MPRAVSRLDRLYGARRQNIIVSLLADDGLMYVDPDSLAYVPLAATSYRYVDPVTVDFEIRRDMRFHDGATLTADDVVYTFNWLLDPRSATKRHRSIKRWLKSVEKTVTHGVRLHLRKPHPLLLRELAINHPIRKLGTYGSLDQDTRHRRAQYERLNGLGPYRVVGFEKNARVEFERFDGYRADSPKGRGLVRRIVLRGIKDVAARIQAIARGDVHFATNIPLPDAEALTRNGRLELRTGPDMRIGFVAMDAAGRSGPDNPFTRLKVRQAVNHAIDRDAIVARLVKGTGRAIHAACHPRQFGCPTDVRRYPYDPGAARRLLAEAGFADGVQVTFWAYRERPVAEAIVRDLNAVGIRVRLHYVSGGALTHARGQGNTQICFGTWGSGGTADASAIADGFWSLDAKRNLALDPIIAVHVNGASSTDDAELRRTAYGRAFARIADHAYWAPLYTFTKIYVMAPGVAYPMSNDGVLRLFRAAWQ